jgi:trans-aconitate 2-methyltransferase
MTAAGAPVWDPAQYERFKRERAQPFFDLLARIPDGDVGSAADLGCGTGELTRRLLERWPRAHVFGVDRSAEMLERGRGDERDARIDFVEADLRQWRAPRPLDRIVSNAALQWVPDHGSLLAHLASQLAPAGVLAVQVPNNREGAAHRLLEQLAEEPRWAERLSGCELPSSVESPRWYLARLRDLDLEAELWETVYYHQLPDAAAVLEWLKGTTLRPVLSALAAEEAAEFLALLGSGLTSAYEAGPGGVVFPFRRLFFVARREGR